MQLIATAQTDGLNPNRYNARGVVRALQAARSGNPGRFSAPRRCSARRLSPTPATSSATRTSASSMSIPSLAGADVGASAAQPGRIRLVAFRLCRADGLDEPDLRPSSPGARQPDLHEPARRPAAPAEPRAGAGTSLRTDRATCCSTLLRRGSTCTRMARWSTRCGWSPGDPTPRRRRR